MKPLLTFGLLLGLTVAAPAAPLVPASHLEIVIVDRPPAPQPTADASADTVAPPPRDRTGLSESNALERLQFLRQQWHASGMRVAIWRFKKPEQAHAAAHRLGLKADELPALCVIRVPDPLKKKFAVQLGYPGRHLTCLYRINRMDQQEPSAIDQVAQVWANQAGFKVPPVALAQPREAPEGMEGLHAGPSALVTNPSLPSGGDIFASEQVRVAAGEAEKRSQLLYLEVKDTPVQGDGPARLALLNVLECARALQEAMLHGNTNPQVEFERLLRARDQMVTAQAWNTMDPELRPDLYRLYRSLDVAQAIFRQLNPSAAVH